MPEKIGSTVLGEGRPAIKLTKRQLEQIEEAKKQVEEEQRKKSKAKFDEELPRLEIAGDRPHEPRLGEAKEIDEVIEASRKKKKKM